MSPELDAAMQKLAKWRMILAGWHLGTASKEAPGVQAMRDLREVVMLMRVEINAQTQLLLRAKIFDQAEFEGQMLVETELYDKGMARRFPGMMSTAEGVTIFDPELASVTMKKKGFPT